MQNYTRITRTIFIISVFLFAFTIVNALNSSDINYPISELGNCGSQEECKNFCDNPENHTACIEWAKSQGVFTAVEAKRMKDIEQMENKPEDPMEGPGGCESPKSCDAYCRLLENLDECLDYGVQNGYTSAEEARKARAQADKGGPNGCKSREECDSFCKNPDNIEECMKFVVEEGKVTQEEADLMIQMAKNKDFGKPKEPEINQEKALKVLEQVGSGPGGCKNMEECKAYCEDMTHGEECLNFAVENGFVPPEEIERVKKMMTLGGPGGCKNSQECDAFCGKEENRDICFNFAKESGLISPEEAMMMEKQMNIINKMADQPGPGGCRSAQECSAYCSDPGRIQECMDFAAKTGMMSKDRVQTMMQQVDQIKKMKEFFMMQGGPQEQGEEGQMMMPPPQGFAPAEGGGAPYEGQGFYSPEGFQAPPEGMTTPPSGEFQMPPNGYPMPSGYPMPPEGWQEGQMPPEGMTMPPSGEFMGPPPGGEIMISPPGEETAPPPSSWGTTSLFGAVLGPFLDIFR